MLKSLRQSIIKHLWEKYRFDSLQVKQIERALKQNGIDKLCLDHFAIIDLPSPHSGIPYLKKLFETIGYIEQGKGYLHEKQNDFLWMAESDSKELVANDVLPQVVIADFRLDELPLPIKKIIETYANDSEPLQENRLEKLAHQTMRGDLHAKSQLQNYILHYLSQRDWPLPTVKEFNIVQEWNELLAWVLIFGRKPNHFTLSIHLLNQFATLADFHHFILTEVKLPLNEQGGLIKGNQDVGIAQGATQGTKNVIKIADGDITLPTDFVEFVWRYSKTSSPRLWKDYFTGFVAEHADRVIESLYQ